VSFGWCLNSAEGAAFSSRGRKAVDQNLEIEVEAGTILRCEMRSSAAPSALDHFSFDYPRPYGRGYLMAVLRTLTLAPFPARLFKQEVS
jgi:hypothetical protein